MSTNILQMIEKMYNADMEELPKKTKRRKKRTRHCRKCKTAVLNPRNTSGLCKDCIRLRAHGGGRPTIMTPEVIKKLEEAFSLGCSDNEACLYANIAKQTLYNYQTKNTEFVDRKELLKEKLVLKARSNIAKSLSAGDSDISKWYLERKKKAEFSTRQESEVTIDRIVDQEVIDRVNTFLGKYSDDEE
jgi:hypothetical protein